jgi:hypothetical protein
MIRFDSIDSIRLVVGLPGMAGNPIDSFHWHSTRITLCRIESQRGEHILQNNVIRFCRLLFQQAHINVHCNSINQQTIMGNTFGSEYNLEDHGQSSRVMYDEYIASEDKFLDLTSKVVAITGTSTKSIGFHVAEVAIKKNAKILLLCNRDSSSSKKGTEDLQALVKECGSPTVIETVACDLQDLESVKSAATKINEIAFKHKGLDMLVCNAGVMALKDIRTKDGFDVQVRTRKKMCKKIWCFLATKDALDFLRF